MHQFRNKPRELRLKEIIICQSIVGLFILIITVYLIIFGFGYKIDLKNMKIIHTGIIYLAYTPKNSEVFINGELKNSGSPFDIILLPNSYFLEIKQNGYNTWSQSINVVADKVASIKNIVLFKQNPEISLITDTGLIASIDAPYDTRVKNPVGDLTSNGYEIWADDNLVTRFSKQISNVIWYPGMEYIAFQQDKEIRIIDKGGKNDIVLAELNSTEPTKFIFSWDGSSLLYRDGAEYKRAQIN